MPFNDLADGLLPCLPKAGSCSSTCGLTISRSMISYRRSTRAYPILPAKYTNASSSGEDALSRSGRIPSRGQSSMPAGSRDFSGTTEWFKARCSIIS